MGYCTINNVKNIIAQALTSSSPGSTGRTDLWDIGNSWDSDISLTLVNEFIRWAGDEIDSDLSEMYRTPLFKISHGEWYLEQDINEYNPTTVVVSDTTNLVPGDEIIIISTAFDPAIKEKHIVATVDDDEFTTVDPIFTDFPAGEETRIVRIVYPPAITLVCARKVAANIYDKYFSAQASPDMSDYGNTLRAMAMDQMSDILNGIIILHGQKRIGNRFANSNLYDRYQILGREGNDTRELKKQ